MTTSIRTYVPRQGQVEPEWWVVDAAGLTLGRLSTAVVGRLRGKHKPGYTPFLDTGDHVIVINAAKVVLSGRKWQDRLYRNHSGYPGGLKEISAEKLRDKHPERLVQRAVRGMLPKGPLGRKIAKKLKVYADEQHPHQAQQPRVLTVLKAARTR